MIQETRGHILEILKTKGASTVDEIVEALHQRTDKRVTPATVRHHLDVLRIDALIEAPAVRRRDTPGRPQYVYHLTDKALDLFPTNYAGLAHVLLNQIKQQLPRESVNVILEGAAEQLAANALIPEVSIGERLDMVIAYLNQQGYQASYETIADGYLLHTSNCPFERVATAHDDLCQLDSHLIAHLTGVIPRRVGRLAAGDASCTYFIPLN